MKIALAQTRAVKGNISVNIENHIRLINQALVFNANAIFFPELSLTGYEPELAENLATHLDDAQFAIFQHTSDAHGITIGLGMPIRTNKGIEITMLIFQPNQSLKTYAKQQLHADELPYFVGGDQQFILMPETLRIAPAICYESLQTGHVQKARDLGAKVYLASVAKSKKGIDKAYVHYTAIARQYQMPVLMVNCVGYCDNFESIGSTAYWNNKGELIAALDKACEDILMVDLNDTFIGIN